MLYFILILVASNILLLAFLAADRQDNKKYLLSELNDNLVRIRYYTDELSELCMYKGLGKIEIPGKSVTYEFHLVQLAYQLASYQRLTAEVTDVPMTSEMRKKYRTVLQHQRVTIDSLQQEIYDLTESNIHYLSAQRIYA